MTRTALVKIDGNHRVMHYDDYKTNAEFAQELRANGFKVVKVWAKYLTEDETSDWLFMNRKRA